MVASLYETHHDVQTWAFKQRDFKKTTNMISSSERHCYIRNDESIMIKIAGIVSLQFTQHNIVYL